MSFYRIQNADRDATDLLDPENWVSYHWNERDEDARPGVSVCASIDDLAAYLAGAGIPIGLGDWVIVELDGDRRQDVTAYDAQFGELLINPTEILSVRPAGDEFYQLIGAAYDAANGE
jgi:hypothetical protein